MFPLSTCATAFGVAHAPNPPLRYLSRCRYLYRPPAYPWRASGLSRCRHRCQPPAHPWRASGPSRCWHRCRPPAHPRRASGPEPPSLEHVRAEGQPFAKKNRGGSRLAGIPLLFLGSVWRSAMHGINRRRLRTLWDGEPEALHPRCTAPPMTADRALPALGRRNNILRRSRPFRSRTAGQCPAVSHKCPHGPAY